MPALQLMEQRAASERTDSVDVSFFYILEMAAVVDNDGEKSASSAMLIEMNPRGSTI